MKGFLCLAAILFFGFTTQAAFTPKPAEVGNAESHETSTITAKQFAKMSVAEFELLTGKKLGIFKRIAFKSMQRKARRDGIFDKEELTEGFKLDAFLIGFLTFGIGWLVCLFVAKDSNYFSWVGWGFRAALLVVGLGILSSL